MSPVSAAEKSHNIIVFGGQGRTGREVVIQALAAGHRVTAFTYHNNGSLPEHNRLTIIEGNARSLHDVSNAVKGHDTVINIIAPKLGDHKNYDISVVATRNILAAMKEHGIQRYFGQCGAWATEYMQDASLLMRLGFVFFLPLRQIYGFKKQEDALVKSSGLDWSIVRAPLLTNGPLRWPVRVYTDRYICHALEVPTISRKSVAKFYVEYLDNPQIINHCPVVLR